MNWWHYLLLANFYLALFYGFYMLFLRRETYFLLNRVYLVSAAVLSFFIPMIQSQWVKDLFITQKVQQTIYYINPGFSYEVVPAQTGFTVEQFFTALYWAVALMLLIRLIFKIDRLRSYFYNAENGAFSFFGRIRVDENLPQQDVIYQHELLHAQHLHSADVLLFEALTILNWFNPVIYFYRKAIKYNHEFMADKNAIDFGADKADYAMLLLSESMGVQPNYLINSFFNQSLLKQRIMMLSKNPSKKSALLKYGLSAPLFGLMLILTSATISNDQTIRKISATISSDTPVREVAVNLTNTAVLPNFEDKSLVKQAFTLQGKVVNINGTPLVGVKVSYLKKNISVSTDQEGDFTIEDYVTGDPVNFKYQLDANYVLVKSFADHKNHLNIVVLQGNTQPANITLTNIKLATDTGSAVSFAAVEKLPYFPGGEQAFGQFLATHIKYPKDAKAQKITGRVIVSFIVEKDGALNNIKVLRDIGGGAGAEAVRVLEESPKWNPGVNEGKVVRVAYTMPINFTLAGDNDNQKKLDSIRINGKAAHSIQAGIILDTVKQTDDIKINRNPTALQPL